MRRRAVEPGMLQVDLLIPEDEMITLQAMVGAASPAETIRAIIDEWMAEQDKQPTHLATSGSSKPFGEKRGQPAAQRGHDAPRSGQDRYPHRGPKPPARGDRPVEAGQDEHPIKAYQRRLREEELHKQRAHRGGNVSRSVGSGNAAPYRNAAGNRATPGEGRASSPPARRDGRPAAHPHHPDGRADAPRPPRKPRLR